MRDMLSALAQAMEDPEFVAAMERMARAFPDYRARLPHIPYAYSRTQLAKTPRYEVVAMQWAGGAVSPIHDHGTSRCWVLMLDGTLEVENFVREPGDDAVVVQSVKSLTLHPGDLDYVSGPHELHRVHNGSPASAFSLQLYADPIQSYTIFDPQTRSSRLSVATCDLELILD